MQRTYWLIGSILLGLLVFAWASPTDAEFGYKDIYQYDEAENDWVLLEPSDESNDTAYMIVRDPAGSAGNSNASLSVAGKLEILPSLSGTRAKSFGMLSEPESLSYTNGPLTITVTPLTDNIEVDTDEGWFILPGTGNYAEWRFVYSVTNLGDVEMKDIEVKDNFGGELEVRSANGSWSASPTKGQVVVSHSGAMKNFKFKWDGFVLAPGESASLTIDVKLGENPAGKQEYTSCNKVYELNSGGVLKFRWQQQQGQGWTSYEGEPFEVWVPCLPSMSIEISTTEVQWFVRKPGDYYTRALTGSVKANCKVAITFSGFDNLHSTSTNQSLLVFYALAGERPEQWC
ncbi:MAG: hypothetical protein ACOYCE_10920 [Limnochordia bacterium]|jgi:hypothetical protein